VDSSTAAVGFWGLLGGLTPVETAFVHVESDALRLEKSGSTQPHRNVVAKAPPVQISFQTLLKPRITPKTAQRDCQACNGPAPEVEGTRCAWVACIFGSKYSYCIEAAVLGSTLKSTGTTKDFVAMHTADVPKIGLKFLQQVGWTRRLVDYIDGDVLYDGSSGDLSACSDSRF
jgi:hypothetical protein